MILEESPTISESLTETNAEVDDTTLMSIDDMVMVMLSKIDNENIDNETLIRLYKELI